MFWLVGLLLRHTAMADDPVLVIDTGGHTAPIRSVLFTGDSRYLVSAGDDKVARVWDVSTGRTVRAFRGQIGNGVEGMIYAAALSPNQKLLALAGHLPGYAIRIHDFQTGEVIGVLQGHTSTVECLAFSSDSRYLVSGDSRGLVRIWDASKMSGVRELRGHRDRVHTVAFSADGSRIVSGGFDKTLRLWNAGNGALIKEIAGHQSVVVSAVFAPDARSFASVSEDGSLRFWNAGTGEPVSEVDHAASRPANLSFTPDGKRLLVTSSSNGRGAAALYSVASNTLGTAVRRNDGTITATAIATDGKTAATAGGGGNEIHLWDIDTGRVVRKLAGQGQPVWSAGFLKEENSNARAILFGNQKYDPPAANAYGPLEERVWLSRVNNSTRVEWGGRIAPNTSAVTAVDHKGDLDLKTAPGPSGEPAVALQVWRGTKLVRQFVRDNTSGYRHMCYTFTQDGRVISGGMNGSLLLYTDSKPLDFVGHTGTVSAVTVSPDNRTLISGSDDQTVRLWDIETRRNLLTVFVGSDNQWVAWTPEGYYTSSIYGEKYIGWHLNQGTAKAAKFWTVAAFRKDFDRPDIVAEQLRLHDIDRAVRAANKNSGLPELPPITKSEVAEMTPPEIRFVAPEENTAVQDETYVVKALAFSTTLPITYVEVRVNGQLTGKIDVNAQSGDVKMAVRLVRGVNNLSLKAYNQRGSAKEQARQVTYTGSAAQRKPNLIFLGIGISRYKTPGTSLQFADKDAEQMRDLFLKQASGTLFDRVQAEFLSNEKADRKGILDKLEWFKRAGSAGDVRILFVAGHGERWGPRNEYFFDSYDHEPGKSAESNDVRGSILLDSLTAIPGKAVLMLDTCHAASVSGGGRRGIEPVDMDGVLAEFKGTPGIVVFAAATGTESSIESDRWKHGAFTAALIDGLTGKIPGTNGVIRTSDLAAWVTAQVPKMTNTQQHPVVYHLPEDELLPFPIFAKGGR
jgi:WD40 repeat protein